MTLSVLCQICDSLSCDIAAVTKGIPHLQTVGGSKACNFQKPGKMGSEKERENV
jgi:hypothetical protein